MRARVYDKEKNKYYISEVYGVINRYGDCYIVDDIFQKENVTLVQYLDFETKPPYKVNIEIIDYNPFSDGEWSVISPESVKRINDGLKVSKEIHYIRGYVEFFENENGLIKLLEYGTVSKNELGLSDHSTKLSGWNYIESGEDIDFLMNEYGGFHDSVLKEMTYVSGDFVEDNRMTLQPVGNKQVRLVFNSDWAKEIEIILLSPRVCHLVPGEENYLADISDASFFIRDFMIYFYTSALPEISDDFDGTYFKSLGMMWRYTDNL